MRSGAVNGMWACAQKPRAARAEPCTHLVATTYALDFITVTGGAVGGRRRRRRL
jgi:hypothetical protein